MDISRKLGKLEKLIEKYKKSFSNNTDNIAAMFAIKRVMTSSRESQIDYLGDFAFDFHNYQEKFKLETSKYEKYLDLIPLRNKIEEKTSYLESLNKNSHMAKKLISLRVLDDMKMLKEERKKLDENPSIYDLAFSEFMKNSNITEEEALEIAVCDVLSKKNNYAYSILGEDYLEAMLLERKIKNKNYEDFYDVFSCMMPNFSSLDKEKKEMEIINFIDFDYFENGLTLVSKKIARDNLDINNLLKIVDEYYNFEIDEDYEDF